MSRKASVFARQNAALVSHKLLKQVGVFEIQGFDCEINFRLGTRRSDF